MTPNTPTVCEPTHVKNMNMNKQVATRLFRMLAHFLEDRHEEARPIHLVG